MSGYDGEGTGGGWGGWGGADAGAAAAPVERNDLADLSAAGGFSLTGGNLAGPGVGFGFAPGPVTNAAADAWAASVEAGSSVSDAIIAPLMPVIEKATSINVGQLVTNVINTILGVAAAATGTLPGVASGVKTGMAVAAAPSAFTTTVTENPYAAAINAGLGSAAPSIAGSDATGPAAAAAAFAGAVEGGQGTTAEGSVLIGSPVLDYRGALVFAGTPTGAGSVTPSLAPSTRGQGAGLRDPFTLGGSAAAQPAIPAGLVLAGLASFLMS